MPDVRRLPRNPTHLPCVTHPLTPLFLQRRKGLTGDGYEESRGGRGGRGVGYDRPPVSHGAPMPAPPSAERPKLSLAPRGAGGAVGSGTVPAKANPFGGATANDAAKHYAEQEKRKADDADKARQARIAEKKKADEKKEAEQHKEAQGEGEQTEEKGPRAVPPPKAHPPQGDRKAVPSPREPGHGAPGRGAGRGERGERGGGRRGGGRGGERTHAGEGAAGAPAPQAAPPPKPKVQPPAQSGPAKVSNAFAALSMDDAE